MGRGPEHHGSRASVARVSASDTRVNFPDVASLIRATLLPYAARMVSEGRRHMRPSKPIILTASPEHAALDDGLRAKVRASVKDPFKQCALWLLRADRK